MNDTGRSLFVRADRVRVSRGTQEARMNETGRSLFVRADRVRASDNGGARPSVPTGPADLGPVLPRRVA